MAEALLQILLAASLVCPPVEAKPGASGAAFLALESYDEFLLDRAFRILDASSRPHVAVLHRSFGIRGRHANLKALWKRFKDKPLITTVYISNEVARRAGKMSKAEVLPNLWVGQLNKALEWDDPATIKAFTSRAERVHNLWLSHGTGELRISILEDNFSEEAAKNVFKALREALPCVPLVRNPVPLPGVYLGLSHADYLESHGVRGQFGKVRRDSTVANLDGVCVDRHVVDGKALNCSRAISPNRTKRWLRSNRGRDSTLLWNARWQGLNGRSIADNKLPLERTADHWISAGDIRLMRRLLKYSERISVP